MKHVLLFIAILGVIACGKVKPSADGFYGESFEITNPISVEEMVNKLSQEQPLENLIVEGTIADVCQAKGCWLSLKAENGADIRVTFKDYGFLVPKDISGKTVVIKGTGQIETTSVADLQHYAEDEGQTPEQIAAITEPLEEFTFVATGVKIN